MLNEKFNHFNANIIIQEQIFSVKFSQEFIKCDIVFDRDKMCEGKKRWASCTQSHGL